MLAKPLVMRRVLLGSRNAALRDSRDSVRRKRSAAAAGLHLVFEGGFFAIHGLVVLAHNGLRNVFGADDIGSLFEEVIDQLSRVNDGGIGTRDETRDLARWWAYRSRIAQPGRFAR